MTDKEVQKRNTSTKSNEEQIRASLERAVAMQVVIARQEKEAVISRPRKEGNIYTPETIERFADEAVRFTSDTSKADAKFMKHIYVHVLGTIPSWQQDLVMESRRQADIFYHEPTNTLVIDPLDNQDEPTTRRPDDGIDQFNKKLEEATRIEGRDIEVSYGLSGLYPEADKISPFEAAILSADSSPYTAQDSPQTLEEYLQQRGNLQPESLDYTPQELPRTFEEYVQHCENLEPEHTLDKDQDQDLER
jgi:hypothetical protein